ncbi:hypothetical protein FEM03_16205 [Phragmitibacter flavus]|uniref:AsmA-like C-terminal domain-containing protein n=1 Tax=Phragmitibacter flavus TaxID=2576071 RepID=A0A5R8KC43_9BACT|nr:hypothetical protein [Phragmitibacter flavus]TLD69861.1 hypothetical protein FEM03_16205 [Phragmitibacter flavus]
MAGLLRRLMVMALIAGILGIGFYVRSESFSRKWCALVVEQCEKRNLFLALDNLTLDPIEGVVAHGLRVYHDQQRRVLLGEVDRLNLDLDYGKMIRHELFLEGIDLHNADVRFPVDSEDPQSEIISISDMNAGMVLVGDRIEMRTAEGTLFGLRIHITGSILKPRPPKVEETEEQKEDRRRKRLEAIRSRRDLIVKIAKGLRHFESAQAPRLEIEINGDLEALEEMTATMRLSANGMRHRDYVCEELSATATYASETLDISRLHVRDHLGEMEASATWRLGTEHVDLHLQSSADLPGFASALLQNDMLREVVFYETPDVVAEGRLLLGSAIPQNAFLPFEGVASVRAGRLATRGELLEGLSMNVGLSTEGCYIRDGILSHKSGSTTFQAMWRHGEGVRYRAVVQMDPRVLIPFARDHQSRETLQRFELNEQSRFYLEIEGEGDELNLQTCRSTGHYDLRNFVYRGVEVEHLTGELEAAGRVHTFRNLKLQREEGEASADLVRHDMDQKKVSFEGIKGSVHVAEVVSCFAPKIATIIDRYRIAKPPQVTMEGDIFYRSPGTDLTVEFRSPGGSGVYPFQDKGYVINDPVGVLKFNDGLLNFNVTGNYNNGPMSCIGKTTLRVDDKAFNFDFKAASFPYEVFGKPAPFKNVKATVASKDGRLDYNVNSSLFGGIFTAKGEASDRKKPMTYNGEVAISAILFKEFARVYSPTNDTAGDFTGHMKFSGTLGDWKSLRGEGALTILNSNLYAVPILGPLTPLIAAVLPKQMKNYNEAKEADCTFTVANGFATTDNIEAVTGVFKLVSKGSVDFLENRIQFEAQARLRGLPGIVFFPVSEILEYVGEGSVGDPMWRPRYFSNTQEKEEFRQPNEAPMTLADQTETTAKEEEPQIKSAQPASRQPATTMRRTSKPKVTEKKAPQPASSRPGSGSSRFNKPGSPFRIGK